MATSIRLGSLEHPHTVALADGRLLDPSLLDIRVEGPFAVGAVLWQRAPDDLVCTVVAKATYALENDLCALLDEADAIQIADDHWDDDPTKSVRIPSDLALFKSTYDVVVVGHAHAAHERPVQDLIVRIGVGSIDKCVEARVPARVSKDGTIERAPPSVRMPLRYEAAAGGPETENPVGIDPTHFDVSTRRYRVPQLVPHNHIVIAGQHVPPIGLGPIAESWPLRDSLLGPEDRVWLKKPCRKPMPKGFDTRFFSVAPVDQRAAEPFRDDERLLLECLHPKHPRLVTNLAGVKPKLSASAFTEIGPLVADTLLVDTDRGVVTLTFRAVALLARPVAMRARMLAAPATESTLSLPSLETTNDIDPLPGAALPFIDRPVRAPLPSRPADAVLPFRSATPEAEPEPELFSTQALPEGAVLGTAPPLAPAPPPVAPAPPAHASAPPPALSPSPALAPPPSMAQLAPPAAAPPPPAPSQRGQTIGELRANAALSMPAVQSDRLRPSTPPARPPSDLPAKPLPGLSAMDSPPAIPPPAPSAPKLSLSNLAPRDKSKSERAPAGDPPRALSIPSAPPASLSSARAASDAALDVEPKREQKSWADPKAPAAPARRVMVDLLHFEPSVPKRLRRSKLHAGILGDFSPPRALRRGDERDADVENEREERGRLDVLRTLSCGTELDAGALRAAAESALLDANDLEIPLFLVAGELRPSFDEVEHLKASARAAQPLAANDKRLAATLAVVNELTASATPAPSETLAALQKQIESAVLSSSLPNRYLADAVDRSLLEQRAYKKRLVLGQRRIRADFLFPGGTTLPAYTPDGTGSMFPLLPSFPCVALVELRPREDMLEQSADALVIVALGRVLRRVR